MTKNRLYTAIFTIIILVFSISCETEKTGTDGLLSSFVSPPDSIQTSVYWYWISDHISKEGVVKDLHAMKEKGINRAFIGNIGLNDLPAGNVKMFSDEWWEITHLALKTATELGIEIGIFNSPGWSQSGGPWIKPEESMRYLASSKLLVKGPQNFSQKLEQPETFFQDVKVVAFPLLPENLNRIDEKNATVKSNPALPGLLQILDNDSNSGVSLPGGSEVSFIFNTKEDFTARSLSVTLAENPASMRATFQALDSKGEYSTISKFAIDRSNSALNVGFKPFAPVVVSLPATTSKSYKLILENISARTKLAEVEISGNPRLERFSEKTLAKMHPTPLPYWDAYLWEQQDNLDNELLAIDAEKVLDISQNLAADGTLTWDVPEGEWMILRTGMTSTNVTNGPASPDATGLEVDKMSKKWAAEHFDRFLGEILRRVPESDRKSFKVVVQDSYETGGQNFTDGFMDEFAERYGYDPTPYLPVYEGFIVNNEIESERFLWDVRRLIADKVAYDYVGGLRDISHEHGLTTWLENYGHWGFPGEFLMYGGQSDEIGGEYWSEGSLGDIENRAASSCGHIYGKNKISAESNTSGGPAFSRFPATMKQRNDRFFAEGINNTLLHVFISQPYEDKNPGVNAWFGNEFDRKNTWFSQLDVYIQYLKRVNFMLQQGLNVADAAYFIGEDAPKMTGITDPPLPVGYQFDYINAEVIERDMTVRNGLLTLPHGTQYRILVLPKQETMRPELLLKIRRLVMEGAVVLGPAPTRSPSLQNQPEADRIVKETAAGLWGNVDGNSVKYRQVGKGMILSGMSMEEAFELIGCVPDCKLPEDNSIHYGHRTLKNGTEIYFISNQTEKMQTVTPEFRVEKREPELWEPTTGHFRFLPAFKQHNGVTAVPLQLEPFESAFIVFREKVKKTPKVVTAQANFPETSVLTTLTGYWSVTFDPLFGGPHEPVQFGELKDWAESADNRIKYYSGTATYQNSFTLEALPEGKEIILDLGRVASMGKVYVNDSYAGGVWTYPYSVRITPFVKPDENEIRIEVVNNWKNRLIGDQNLPESERTTWSLVNPYNKNSALQPSGLFGPVNVKMKN